MRQEQKMENICLAKYGYRNICLASYQPHCQNRLSCEFFVLRGICLARHHCKRFFSFVATYSLASYLFLGTVQSAGYEL